MSDTIVLAYSGGLGHLGSRQMAAGRARLRGRLPAGGPRQRRRHRGAERRAGEAGAKEFAVVDAREDFLRYFAFPALAANAVYEGAYPLATALGRPLIAKLLVDKARESGAAAVAHGCTGKGNDQVRFDIALRALARTSRSSARRARTSGPATKRSPTAGVTASPSRAASPRRSPSTRTCGAARSRRACSRIRDDPAEDAYAWTQPLDNTPAEPATVELRFEQGVPVALDGEAVAPVALVERLNEIAGAHGVGRIDMVENRLVGIKSREVYEAPAAVALLAAHRKLETLTLSKQQLRMKERVAQEYADLVYDGLWFSTHHQDLAAYVHSTQRHVTGEVRLRFWRGHAEAVGVASDRSLYHFELATYGSGDAFDQQAALGFIKLWGLPLEVQARQQLLRESPDPLRLAAPGAE